MHDDAPLCNACHGSGEGMHDGTKCRVCKGEGVLPEYDEDRDDELDRRREDGFDVRETARNL